MNRDSCLHVVATLYILLDFMIVWYMRDKLHTNRPISNNLQSLITHKNISNSND